MSLASGSVPGMDEPPSRYDVTVWVAKEDGHQPDQAAFAAAASQATSGRNPASSAHTRLAFPLAATSQQR
jgi:hypothetical protein